MRERRKGGRRRRGGQESLSEQIDRVSGQVERFVRALPRGIKLSRDEDTYEGIYAFDGRVEASGVTLPWKVDQAAWDTKVSWEDEDGVPVAQVFAQHDSTGDFSMLISQGHQEDTAKGASSELSAQVGDSTRSRISAVHSPVNGPYAYAQLFDAAEVSTQLRYLVQSDGSSSYIQAPGGAGGHSRALFWNWGTVNGNGNVWADLACPHSFNSTPNLCIATTGHRLCSVAVLSRDGSEVVFRVQRHDGAVWSFDCPVYYLLGYSTAAVA